MSWKLRIEGLNLSLAGISWNHVGSLAFAFESLYSAEGKRQGQISWGLGNACVPSYLTQHCWVKGLHPS